MNIKKLNSNLIIKPRLCFKYDRLMDAVNIYLKNNLIGLVGKKLINILDNVTRNDFSLECILINIFNFSKKEYDKLINGKEIYKNIEINKVLSNNRNKLFEVFLNINNVNYLYFSTSLDFNSFNNKPRYCYKGLYTYSYDTLEKLLKTINEKVNLAEKEKDFMIARSVQINFEYKTYPNL